MGTNKRYGFTMVETIFAIVILGILASIAVTRMSATRTDSQITKAETEFHTAMKDFATYYLANGKFDDPQPSPFSLSGMTFVPLRIEDNTVRGNLFVGTPANNNEYCIHFHTFNSSNGSYMIYTNADNPTSLCQQLLELPSIKPLLTGRQTTIFTGSQTRVNRQ